MFKQLFLWLAAPIAKRVLVALGIGVITYNLSTAAIDYFILQINSSLSSSTGVVLQMASLFGVPDAFGIVLGAMVTNTSLQVIKKFGFM